VYALGSENNQDLTPNDIDGDGNVSDIRITFYGFKKMTIDILILIIVWSFSRMLRLDS